MNLTAVQKQAVENGAAVPVTVGATECVVIRRDVYERVQVVLRDEGDPDPSESYPAAVRAWDESGSPEDATLYQDVEPE